MNRILVRLCSPCLALVGGCAPHFVAMHEPWGISRHDAVANLSVEDLLAQPALFHEKVVSVTGFAHCEFEDSHLWASKQAYVARLEAKSVRVRVNDQFTLAECIKFSDRRIVATGYFSAPRLVFLHVLEMKVL